MRVTISKDPVPQDFTWNGSVSAPGGALNGGETEDYPIDVVAPSGGMEPLTSSHGLWLGPAMPNPAIAGTVMQFSLSRAGSASLAVFDMAGRKVRGLASGSLSAGPHIIQ